MSLLSSFRKDDLLRIDIHVLDLLRTFDGAAPVRACLASRLALDRLLSVLRVERLDTQRNLCLFIVDWIAQSYGIELGDSCAGNNDLLFRENK